MDKIIENDYKHPRIDELYEIFPEGVIIHRRRVQFLKQEQKKYTDLTAFKAKVTEIYSTSASEEEKKTSSEFHYWLMITHPIEQLEEQIKKLEAGLHRYDWRQSNQYHNDTEITATDIGAARAIPIESFLEVPRSNHVKCLFHSEKSPSMAIYRSKNTFHCFGCEAHGDVIDIVRKLYNFDFLTAVRFLLNK